MKKFYRYIWFFPAIILIPNIGMSQGADIGYDTHRKAQIIYAKRITGVTSELSSMEEKSHLVTNIRVQHGLDVYFGMHLRYKFDYLYKDSRSSCQVSSNKA